MAMAAVVATSWAWGGSVLGSDRAAAVPVHPVPVRVAAAGVAAAAPVRVVAAPHRAPARLVARAPLPADSAANPPAPARDLPQARLAATMTPSSGAPGTVIHIAGRLTRTDGKPVDGASIAIQGSFSDVPRAFSATDRQGRFTAALQVPLGTAGGPATIRASLVGDTRYRATSQQWRFTVVAGAATPSSPSPQPTDTQTAGQDAEAVPDSSSTDVAGAGTSDIPSPGAASLPASSGTATPPGVLDSFGGRRAVGIFLVVLGGLVALALIGWVIRALARLIHRIRHGRDPHQGSSDGANDLFS